MNEKLMNKLNNTPAEDVVIELKNVTKDYGKGRGIFDISLKIPRGCVFGYCGTNGAGKTTTLRHIMGFIKPDKGEVYLNGVNPRKYGVNMMKEIGYLPGEIAFPPVESGSEFLKLQAQMIGISDMSDAERYISMLQLDPTANLKRMSKGMKQKTAIVCAFMHKPNIILLDEPTTGLDPLMREAFIEILDEAKARGATILMSNHMFDELEETCDYVGFIDKGHLIDIVDVKELNRYPQKDYVVTFVNKEEYDKALNMKYEIKNKDEDKLSICFVVDVDNTKEFLSILSDYKINSLKENKYSLHRYFMEHFGGELDGSNC